MANFPVSDSCVSRPTFSTVLSPEQCLSNFVGFWVNKEEAFKTNSQGGFESHGEVGFLDHATVHTLARVNHSFNNIIFGVNGHYPPNMYLDVSRLKTIIPRCSGAAYEYLLDPRGFTAYMKSKRIFNTHKLLEIIKKCPHVTCINFGDYDFDFPVIVNNLPTTQGSIKFLAVQ